MVVETSRPGAVPVVIRLKVFIGILLAVVFSIVGTFHVIWVFRGLPAVPVVPVIPDGPILRPSQLATLAVAAALAGAVLVVLARADLILRSAPRAITTLACAALGVVFVLRAMGDFRLMGFFKRIRDTDFAVWDTWLYSPLCLAIGLASLWLATTPRVLSVED